VNSFASPAPPAASRSAETARATCLISHLVLSLLSPGKHLAGDLQQLPFPLVHLDRVAPQGALHCASHLVWLVAIFRIVLRPLITALLTLALNSELWLPPPE
jgi:hypothetical protein